MEKDFIIEDNKFLAVTGKYCKEVIGYSDNKKDLSAMVLKYLKENNKNESDVKIINYTRVSSPKREISF